MKFFRHCIVLTTLLLLSACTLVEVTNDNPEEVPAENTEESLNEILDEKPVRETKNVTYTGTVQPAGISIYQQGSHRLSLPGGKFVLLESDSLDLNGYVSEEVTIFGSLRPTVEAGGMIMRVERIELILNEDEDETDPLEESENLKDETEENSEEELPVDDNTDENPEEEETEPELEPGDEESADPEEVSDLPEENNEGDEEEEIDDGDEEAEAEEVRPEPSAEFVENVELMARQDYGAENWTQQYCSSHIGFCAPVHRNWWFKSFGTTGQKLWHVELSSAPIDSMGQGPISIDLIAGEVPVADGTIDEANGDVVGYAAWTFGRHFVVTADSSLSEAVEYITKNITEYVQ